MFKKNLLSFTLVFFIILSLIFYKKLNIESANFEKSYIEFKTDKNLKIELSKGKYFVYKINRINDNLDYKIIKKPNQKNTFEFITSEKKEGLSIKAKLKTTINDKVYETIGSFIVQENGKVLFDFKNLNNEIDSLAYKNETNNNLTHTVIFYYLMLFSITISGIIGIVILIKKLRKYNGNKVYKT